MVSLYINFPFKPSCYNMYTFKRTFFGICLFCDFCSKHCSLNSFVVI